MKRIISILFGFLAIHCFAQTEPISPLYHPENFAANTEDSENPFYLGISYTNGLNAYRLFGYNHETHFGYKVFFLSPNLLNDSLEQHDFRLGLTIDKMISNGLRTENKQQIPNNVYTYNEGSGAAIALRYTQASKRLKPYIELELGLRPNRSYISAYNQVLDSSFRSSLHKDYFSIGISGGTQINIIKDQLKLDFKMTYLSGLNVKHYTPASPSIINNAIEFQTINKPINFLQFNIGILISFESLRELSEILNFQNPVWWY